MTYMLLLNCALKLVEEIILYYDARLKKHQMFQSLPSLGGLMRQDVSEPVLVAGHWLGRIKRSLALQLTFLQSASECLL